MLARTVWTADSSPGVTASEVDTADISSKSAKERRNMALRGTHVARVLNWNFSVANDSQPFEGGRVAVWQSTLDTPDPQMHE